MDVIKVCQIARLSISRELENSVKRVLAWAEKLPESDFDTGNCKLTLHQFREDRPSGSSEKEKIIIAQFARRKGKQCLVPRSI